MGTDLGKLMRKLRLSDEKIQYLGYQILKGLKVNSSALIVLEGLFFFSVVDLINAVLPFFTAVYSFCWHYSQGKFVFL